MKPFDLLDTERGRELIVPASTKHERDYNNSYWYNFLINPKGEEYLAAAEYLIKELGIGCYPSVNERAAKFLLCNLVQLHNSGRDVITYYRTPSLWPTNDREKNPFRIGCGKTLDFVDAMLYAGYLETIRGYQGYHQSRAARMWHTDKLVKEVFEPFGLISAPVTHDDNYYLVRIRESGQKDVIPALRSTKVTKMERMLRAYNELLDRIDIRVPMAGKHGQDISHYGRIYRIFNSLDLSTGGRFYGSFWTHIDRDLRPHILIDGEPTIELDYKANHLYLLYGAYKNLRYSDFYHDGDPYYILKPDSDVPYDRQLIKDLALVALNSESANSTWRALHDMHKGVNQSGKTWGEIERGKNPELFELYTKRKYLFMPVYEQFLKKHHHIEEFVSSGIGRQLQAMDSDIAAYVLEEMTSLGIPCLCIHDSFRVNTKYKEILEQKMTEAYLRLGIEKATPIIK